MYNRVWITQYSLSHIHTRIHKHTHAQTDLSIRLDHRAAIFQNLNGATDEVNLMFTSNQTYAYNSIYDTTAVVYHGNGPSKVNSPCKLRDRDSYAWYMLYSWKFSRKKSFVNQKSFLRSVTCKFPVCLKKTFADIFQYSFTPLHGSYQ